MLRRNNKGLAIQRQRLQEVSDNAPRLLAGTPYEVINLTGDDGLDLDYYVYELVRLSDMAKSIITIFGKPQELVDAQYAFDSAIPKLRDIRNPLTHPNDNDELDDVAWFSSLVRLTGFGGVQDLVDPRYGHHDAAMAYSEALRAFLKPHVSKTTPHEGV
jgi:hypothetical protein